MLILLLNYWSGIKAEESQINTSGNVMGNNSYLFS